MAFSPQIIHQSPYSSMQMAQPIPPSNIQYHGIYYPRNQYQSKPVPTNFPINTQKYEHQADAFSKLINEFDLHKQMVEIQNFIEELEKTQNDFFDPPFSCRCYHPTNPFPSDWDYLANSLNSNNKVQNNETPPQVEKAQAPVVSFTPQIINDETENHNNVNSSIPQTSFNPQSLGPPSQGQGVRQSSSYEGQNQYHHNQSGRTNNSNYNGNYNGNYNHNYNNNGYNNNYNGNYKSRKGGRGRNGQQFFYKSRAGSVNKR